MEDYYKEPNKGGRARCHCQVIVSIKGRAANERRQMRQSAAKVARGRGL